MGLVRKYIPITQCCIYLFYTNYFFLAYCCQSEDLCISKDKVCDGIAHCLFLGDESSCPRKSKLFVKKTISIISIMFVGVNYCNYLFIYLSIL